MMAIPISLPKETKQRAEVTCSKSHRELRANPSGEWGYMPSGLWGAVHCIQLPALSDSLRRFVSCACSAKQSSQTSQGAEERGVSSSPHQHADSALVSLVKGSWPFHVMAHYIRAVSPSSAAKMRPLIHVSSFSLPA